MGVASVRLIATPFGVPQGRATRSLRFDGRGRPSYGV